MIWSTHRDHGRGSYDFRAPSRDVYRAVTSVLPRSFTGEACSIGSERGRTPQAADVSFFRVAFGPMGSDRPSRRSIVDEGGSRCHLRHVGDRDTPHVGPRPARYPAHAERTTALARHHGGPASQW